jgi:hypothetical protein
MEKQLFLGNNYFWISELKSELCNWVSTAENIQNINFSLWQHVISELDSNI